VSEVRVCLVRTGRGLDEGKCARCSGIPASSARLLARRLIRQKQRLISFPGQGKYMFGLRIGNGLFDLMRFVGLMFRKPGSCVADCTAHAHTHTHTHATLYYTARYFTLTFRFRLAEWCSACELGHFSRNDIRDWMELHLIINPWPTLCVNSLTWDNASCGVSRWLRQQCDITNVMADQASSN
jgi:hypothetical protein